MWVFSGVFFASENFPEAMQPFISLLPLTALNQALRGVMIDGSGLPVLVPQVAILVGMDARELHGGAAALPLALIAARLVPRGQER